MKLTSQRRVPIILRGLNFLALVLLGIILVPATVVRLDQLIILLPAFMLLIGVYWIFQNDPRVFVFYFGISVSIILWIAICENVVAIDNVLGSHISRNLSLGMRLQAFVKSNLNNQKQFRVGCCGDPLSFSYKPGTVHTVTYDCCTEFSEPYHVTVDSTGNLNRHYDLITNGSQVEAFIAGDSMLQGAGSPSIVERLNVLLAGHMWNLSIGAYGPRQKVSALLAHAIPRHPKWIIIDFFSGNDINDVIRDELCEDSDNFHCIFNPSERRRRILRHPAFSSMVDKSKYVGGLFDDYTEDNLTVAVTRYLVDSIKAVVKEIGNRRVDFNSKKQSVNGEEKRRVSLTEQDPGGTLPGANPDFIVQQTRKFDWLKEGMRLTYGQYDRLAAEVGKMQQPPTIILLYNPAPYEIYRDLRVDRNRETDRMSEFQRQALGEYAEKRGWRFLDLTEPLSEEVAQRGVWLYGRYDRTHWSAQGTETVAPVLARELVKVMGKTNGRLPIVSSRIP